MLLDILKPEVKENVLNDIKERVKELSDGLLSLDGSTKSAGKAMYYISELKKQGNRWNEIVEWPDEQSVNLCKELFQREGADEGWKELKVKTGLQCPYCGLTPLGDCPLTRDKLSDYYCNTCNKFVVFASNNYNLGNMKLRVTDDIIIVLKRQ